MPKARWMARWMRASRTPKAAVYSWKRENPIRTRRSGGRQAQPGAGRPDSRSYLASTSSRSKPSSPGEAASPGSDGRWAGVGPDPAASETRNVDGSRTALLFVVFPHKASREHPHPQPPVRAGPLGEVVRLPAHQEGVFGQGEDPGGPAPPRGRPGPRCGTGRANGRNGRRAAPRWGGLPRRNGTRSPPRGAHRRHRPALNHSITGVCSTEWRKRIPNRGHVAGRGMTRVPVPGRPPTRGRGSGPPRPPPRPNPPHRPRPPRGGARLQRHHQAEEAGQPHPDPETGKVGEPGSRRLPTLPNGLGAGGPQRPPAPNRLIRRYRPASA